MNIEAFRNYCISKKEVTEGFPFANLPNLLVFKVAGKMFAVTDVNIFDSIGVRCNAECIDELRAKYPALQKPPYFSDRHWTLIIMDKSIPDKLILKWIDESCELAIKKLTKKLRTELGL
jgi:predicted DNA-binding protein (MmcQ/YjbR family)